MLSHSGILREIDFIIDGRGVTHHAYTIVFRDGERATVKVPTLINEQEAALSVSAQGAEPVAWITADAIESLQADGMCALAAGRKQSAVYSVPIYTNPVPVQGAEPFAWYWFDQHDCLYIVADSRKPEFPEAVYPLYTHPNP